MRALIALTMLALVGCQVSKDKQNDTVTATYNGEVAENAAEDVGNVAKDVANDVENVADKVENRAKNVDIDVKGDANKAN